MTPKSLCLILSLSIFCISAPFLLEGGGIANADSDARLVSVNTNKDHYKLGDAVIITGTVSERAFLLGQNYIQMPLHITVSSDWDANIQIYIDGDLNFINSFSLSPKVGFKEGIYKLHVEYNGSTYDSTFTVGDGYKLYHYQKTTLAPLEKEIEMIDKVFTVNTDKTKYAFGDRMLINGFLKNMSTDSYYTSASVRIQILDENKKQLQTEFYTKNTARSIIPSLYDFKSFPRTGTGYAINQDIGFDGLGILKPGEYRSSVAVTPLDFLEDKTYYVVATYGKQKVEVPFVVYDKFAHMTDIFEIYLDDKLYSPGDTVTVTGLAPHAVGGAGQSKQITGFTQEDDGSFTPTIKRSSSSGDNHYVYYTVFKPDGEKETGQVKVENGEFTIQYEISKYLQTASSFEGYSIQADWSSHSKYVSFHVIK